MLRAIAVERQQVEAFIDVKLRKGGQAKAFEQLFTSMIEMNRSLVNNANMVKAKALAKADGA